MTKIKICGLTRMQDADVINQYKPDYAGFVFYEKSQRYVTPEQAEALRYRIHQNILTVGVFVNAELKYIKKLVNKNIIQVVQLHGHEAEYDIELLRQCIQSDIKIIKAFSIETVEDIQKANETSADYPLLDHGTGGTGDCFDWKLLKGMKRDFFLAGGLNPFNVQEAINLVHPFAVDVSSGVETRHHKDENKIKLFVTNVLIQNTEK